MTTGERKDGVGQRDVRPSASTALRVLRNTLLERLSPDREIRLFNDVVVDGRVRASRDSTRIVLK